MKKAKQAVVRPVFDKKEGLKIYRLSPGDLENR